MMSRRERSPRFPWLVFETLLRTYPPALRRKYGDEMRDMFLAGYRTARQQSLTARIRFWWHTVSRTVVHGVGARREGRNPTGRATGGPTGSPLHPADVRRAARALVRSPGFSLTVLTVLAVGIGASTAIATLAYSTLMRPLPYADPGRVVVVWNSAVTNGQLRDVIAGPVALDLARENRTFTALAAYKPDDVVLLRGGRPTVVAASNVTTEFFDVLGIEPFLGRWFDESEGYEATNAVAVVSHGFWRETLGADSSAVGRRLELRRGPVTVVGVLPEDFYFPHGTSVIQPLAKDVLETLERTNYDYWLLGRLRLGVTPAAAEADLDGVMQDIIRQDPRLSQWTVLVEPFQHSVAQFVRPALILLTVGGAFVVLIVVANIANLFLIRTAARRHEVVLQRALGASTARTLAGLLAEGGLLATLGAIGALGVARVTLHALPLVAPDTIPIPGSAAQVQLVTPTMGPGTVMFTAAVSLVALAVYLAPSVWQTLRAHGRSTTLDVSRTATASARGRRLQDGLVAAELSVAALLLVGAGLTVRTTFELLAVDAGLARQNVLTMYVGDLGNEPAQGRARFFEEMLREVQAVPGVVSAAVNDYVPLQSEDDYEGVRFPDRAPPLPGQGPREEWRRVSSEYFATAGIRLIEGRAFTPADNDSGPSVAVVNQAFARRYYPDRSPLDETIRLTNQEYDLTRIVGVVDDVRRRGLAIAAPPVVYVPFHRRPRSNMALFVRTQGNPLQSVERIKAAVWRAGPTQPIDRINTMERVFSQTIGVERVTAFTVSALSAVALLLAAVGVYGVMSYSVRLRHREMGIRLALGASPAAIRKMILVHSSAVAALGLAVGLGMAALSGQWTAALLFRVPPTDPASYLGAGATLLVVAAVSAYLPARRATQSDPTLILRD